MYVSPRPIVPHYLVTPDPGLTAQVDAMAAQLRQEGRLRDDARYLELIAARTDAGPTLVLDDISAIRIPPRPYDVAFVMDRARLRAGQGDPVLSLQAPARGYEDYCRRFLNLGSCHWLQPRPTADRRHLARACWCDRKLFQALVNKVRERSLVNLDPYQGSPDVWELAVRVSKAARRPLFVIAPPPNLALFVNDKVSFTATVCELFGRDWAPPATQASSLDKLCRQLREWAKRGGLVGVKTPDSAGGAGNLVLSAQQVLESEPQAFSPWLEKRLRRIGWEPGLPVLAGPWFTDIVHTPSAQLWIPPQGQPIVEGIFLQLIRSDSSEFIGSQRAVLPHALSREIAHRSWLLARLFQHLGYCGRCSFDMVIRKDDLPHNRFIFVECNGRWGGTSMPMTLMNRLFGDCYRQPYFCGALDIDGLQNLSFADLLQHFVDDLYHAEIQKGRLIFFNPGRLKARHGIEVIALGETDAQARALFEFELPERVTKLIG